MLDKKFNTSDTKPVKLYASTKANIDMNCAKVFADNRFLVNYGKRKRTNSISNILYIDYSSSAYYKFLPLSQALHCSVLDALQFLHPLLNLRLTDTKLS